MRLAGISFAIMPGDEPHLLAKMQSTYNRSTRDHWDHFAAHRRRVADLLVPPPDPLLVAAPRPAGGRLCVLGAGNCNDLDLPALLEHFNQIDLVDLDADALAAATTRQGVASDPCVRTRGGVDLTAVAPIMAQWPARRPSDAAVNDCVRTLNTAPQPDVGGPFDVLLSPCLLSQICLFASDVMGKSHPRRRDVREAIRRRHVRQMVEWLAPGGTGLLVIDLVTTDRLGSLVHTHQDRLDDVARRTVARSDHFPGLDPAALQSALADDPMLTGMVDDVRVVPPWVWTLGPHKAFLVYALRFRRSRTPVFDTPRPWSPTAKK